MAYPSVTYTFSNSTTADASQVNQNFTDLINGLSDGTKDLNISALTAAGTTTLNGAVTLGNASGDDITVTGSLASSIPIKTTFSYDIGSATLGLRYIFLGSNDSAARSVKLSAGAVTSSYTITLPAAVPGIGKSVLTFDTSANASFENRAVQSIRTETDNYTVVVADEVILMNCSASKTVTLPAAATTGLTGKRYKIKKIDSSLSVIITIDGNGAETIDGATTKKLSTQYEEMTLISDGTSWHVIERWYPSGWVSYSPSWTATGTAPSIGNGSLTGFYRRVGDSAEIQIHLKGGNTTTYGTTDMLFSLPITIDTAKLAPATPAVTNTWVGSGLILDSGTANFHALALYKSTTTIQAVTYTVNATYPTIASVADNVPMTWTTSDELNLNLRVPVANWEG